MSECVYFSCRLLLVEQWNTVISASVDTSVRVWTLEGNFIGITIASNAFFSKTKCASENLSSLPKALHNAFFPSEMDTLQKKLYTQTTSGVHLFC